MTYWTDSIIKCLAFMGVAVSAYGASQDCVVPKTSAGGDPVVSRFIAAPMPRAHEAVADAMQAMGVFLFNNREEFVEGERTEERVGVLKLPHGDEAIRAELSSSNQDGKAGTQVRVETKRRRNQKGAPKHVWSSAVLDQTVCLVSLLSVDDPLHRPKTALADGPEVRLADSVPVAVRSRRFFFNADLKVNQAVPFETAEDIVMNDSVAIPAGSFVMASVVQSSDIGEFGRGAQGQLQFRYLVLPDGAKLPLRGGVDLRGKGANLNKAEKSLVIVGSIAAGADFASGAGSGFAVPAGTLFYAEVAGEQKFRTSRATSVSEPSAK
jgi:hypothetical protein